MLEVVVGLVVVVVVVVVAVVVVVTVASRLPAMSTKFCWDSGICMRLPALITCNNVVITTLYKEIFC